MTDSVQKQLETLSRQIIPCDMSRPYAFVSYSSRDALHVWGDVLRLQQDGYNIWIDLNLKSIEQTWDPALRAISHFGCRVVMFYLSKASATSSPCLKELKRMGETETMRSHNNNEPKLLRIEVSPVGQVVVFRNRVYEEIRSDGAARMRLPAADINRVNEETRQRFDVLGEMMDAYFGNDDLLRLKCAKDPDRRTEYFTELESNLQEAGVRKMDSKARYIRCVKAMDDPTSYQWAIAELQTLDQKEGCQPAAMLLAFIFRSGVCGAQYHDTERAEGYYFSAELEMSGEQRWQDIAARYEQGKDTAAAAAYYAAYGVKTGSREDLKKAWMLWMRNLQRNFTVKCMEEQAMLGDPTAARLSSAFRDLSSEDFVTLAKRLGMLN